MAARPVSTEHEITFTIDDEQFTTWVRRVVWDESNQSTTMVFPIGENTAPLQVHRVKRSVAA